MKLTEKILVAVPYSGPVGSIENGPFLGDEPINEVQMQLIESGVPIKPMYSEVEIMYESKISQYRTEERIAIVPILVSFPEAVSPRAKRYFFRGEEGLELELRNYHHITQRPQRGMIGGTIAGEMGIQCDVSLEGKTTDLEIIRNIRSVLTDLYTPGRNLKDAVRKFPSKK